ncbi:cystathionine beta-lyase [Sphingobium lignivorans]|uniref:Cystathionine beta-lyase n=1 Tax=Sphingobium lignivorans TaxID=2735886 RepID=A0ABR6NL04_9SPHN|nr:cystathionine beta-lyase [Sphingobium lignivorans]MBB5987961.1 cystathionine beta-lyase [Sphingobium lignivorans]
MSDSGKDKGGKPLSAATRLVQAGRRAEWTGMPGQPGGIVNPPVWRASTILYEDVAHLRSADVNDPHRLYYGRRGAPTSWALAEAITQMEPEAAGTMLYPSGVAAISGALLALLRPGDELLMVDSVYGPTRALCEGLLREMGITTRYYDPLIGSGIADLFHANTRAIFMESPGSLTFEVQDIPAIVAAARERGIITLLDNTWATPLLLPGLGMGVDVSILACTKYIVGHSDVMMGSVSANAALWPRIRQGAHTLGQMASPDDAWLALRGLRTLAVRLKHQGESALAIARWLSGRPEVARVLHPALPDCAGHDIFLRDFASGTGLFAFELAGGGERERAAFIDSLGLFGIGYSWGGYESLAIPVDLKGLRSATAPARGPLVRVNIGLEDVADLIADIEQALAVWKEAIGP